jgi:hypothetical protein
MTAFLARHHALLDACLSGVVTLITIATLCTLIALLGF